MYLYICIIKFPCTLVFSFIYTHTNYDVNSVLYFSFFIISLFLSKKIFSLNLNLNYCRLHLDGINLLLYWFFFFWMRFFSSFYLLHNSIATI